MSAAHRSECAWTWDGRAEGLLLLAYRAFRDGSWPGILVAPSSGEGMLFAALGSEAAAVEPKWEAEAAYRLHDSCEPLFELCLRAWMSEEGVEPKLLSVAALVGREGFDAAEDYSRPEVRALRAACARVEWEIRRLEGLARFSPRRDGLYSAPLEPDHNVLAALLPHFSRRFGSQAFALVDLHRRIAFESREGKLRACAGEAALALLPDRGEEEDATLWRRYFQATENPARLNPKLQRRLMPARYWKYLPELARSR